MTVAEYVAALLRRGIDVGLEGEDGLFVDGPDDLVSDDLLAFVRENKAVIVEWLKRPVSQLPIEDLRAFDVAPHAFGHRPEATREDEAWPGFEGDVDATELDAEEHALHVRALDQWLAEVDRVRAEKDSTPETAPDDREARADDSQRQQDLLRGAEEYES